MQDAVVNGELTITIPEGFKVLDSEGLKELYNDDNADRWGMMDDQRHMVLSVFWHKNGGLVSFLAKPKDVCLSTEKKLSKALKDYGYELEGFYEKDLCGKKACGFRHIHTIKGVEYTSEVTQIMQGRVCYTIYAYSRSDNETENRPVLNEILDGMRF